MSLDDERVPLPEGAAVEDLRGRYLIPGLVRLSRALGRLGRHRRWHPIEHTDDRLAHDYGATLAAGVTSVVSLTDDLDNMRIARRPPWRRASSGRRARSSPGRRSPRAAGIPAEMFSFLPGLAEQLTRQVETPEEARAAIAELDRARVDLVKLVLEPGFEDRPLPRLREEVFRAAMAEAKARKMQNDGARRHRRGRAAGDRRWRQRHRAHALAGSATRPSR